MAHREPDPRLPPRARPQASAQNPIPPSPGGPRARPQAEEPGDFLGLGMELSAKVRRTQAEDAASPRTPLQIAEQAEPLRMATPPAPKPQPAQRGIPPQSTQRASPPQSTQRTIPSQTTQRASPPQTTQRAIPPPPAPRAPTSAPAQSFPSAPAQAFPPKHAAPPAQTFAPHQPFHPAQALPPMPTAPNAPTSMAKLMQPLPFEVQPPRTEETVRTNSWLLALDDARSGQAGDEPVVADPSNLRRAPRVAKQLDTSFSEPTTVGRRTAPWLVGLLGATAAASLLFVIVGTLTKVDPKAVAGKKQAPIAPHAHAIPVEQLTDPLDAPPVPVSKHTKVASTRPTPRPIPPEAAPAALVPNAQPASTSRPRALPVQEPTTAPPQQDILILPEVPTPDPADTAPASDQGGGEQAAAGAPLGEAVVASSWWPGALRATPLAVSESAPGADEYAASNERQARVAQWLMLRSRGASPHADTGATFPSVAEAELEERAAASAIATSEDTAVPAVAARSTNPSSDFDAASVSVVWEGSTVPANRITANVRLLTPQVGRVRAGLRNGQWIEGRLYAVGTGRVWIDADIGRIALQRGEIVRLEQIATLIDDDELSPVESDTEVAVADAGPSAKPATPVVAVKPPPVAEPPPRVRVKTPGGLFFGQIIAREGTTLTLLTDEGSRITLESEDIEPAPLSKAVVKREPVPKTPPAGTPPH